MPYEGGAVPVVDLRKRFELDAPIREETRLMVVDLGDQRVGVLVDEVREVMRVDSTTITAPGPMVSGLAAAYIAGIVTRPERTIIILNARKLLSSTERLALTGIWGRAMSEPWLGALRAQFQAIEARLGTAGQPADREALKRDIIALFKRVDAALARSRADEGGHPRAGRAVQAGRPPRRSPRRPSSPAPGPPSTPTTSAPRPTSRRAGA